MWHHPHFDLSISFDVAGALVIFALALVTAGFRMRSLFGALRSAARWESGSPTGSAGFHLRSKAHHESMQIAPPHPVDRLTWAHSAQTKERFKAEQAATAAALRASADAADYGDTSARALRAEFAAERRANVAPEAVLLGVAVVTAILALVLALP